MNKALLNFKDNIILYIKHFNLITKIKFNINTKIKNSKIYLSKKSERLNQ